MSMIFKNKEILIYFMVNILIGVLGVICYYLSERSSAFIFIFAYTLSIIVTLIFTMWRYKKIDELSMLIEQIASGDYLIDIREYSDGELSILKSEIYKLTRTLSHTTEELKKDKISLSRSLSDISHQLKTPLTSITMMAELLSKEDIKEEKREEFFTNIFQSLARIEWLITSLLKISRIDAGTIEFKRKPINLLDLIKKSLKQLEVIMEIKKQKVVIDVEDYIYLIGDENWLSEAILNIVKNCTEHNKEGGIIKIKSDQNSLYTEIVISDNGPGISEEDLPHIFERFYRGKNSGADSVGIGLALSSSIIKNNNGSVLVKNLEEGGASFRIRFYSTTY